MGNSASALPEQVGGQVKKATERMKMKMERKVRGKKPARDAEPSETLPFEGGRRLAVCCDTCGAIIHPGQKFMPVRGVAPGRDHDVCAACADSFTSAGEGSNAPSLLSEPWRPRFASLPLTVCVNRRPRLS
jgi:hypothetical protein